MMAMTTSSSMRVKAARHSHWGEADTPCCVCECTGVGWFTVAAGMFGRSNTRANAARQCGKCIAKDLDGNSQLRSHKTMLKNGETRAVFALGHVHRVGTMMA